MPNQEGLYTKEEWSGLMNDKQGEVKSRQETQAELALARAENIRLNARIDAIGQEKVEKIENPEETVTRAEQAESQRKLRAELRKDYLADKANEKRANREAAVDGSFDKAREKYTLEIAGKGLTFDEVFEGTKRQIKEDKDLGKVIFNAKNPGEKAYKIGLLDPVIAKRKALSKQEFTDSKKTPKIGMESNEVPGQFFSQERVGKMTRAEITANYPAIKESQKKWKK